jgi:hypothetical protein
MFLSDRLITALCFRLLCIFLCNLFLLRYLLFLVLRGVFMNLSIVFLLYVLVFMLVFGVYFVVMFFIISVVCVFGLGENNVSGIVRFGLCCVECYLFVCCVVGSVYLVGCVASGGC